MSQRSEKLHRRVGRLEEQIQFVQNSMDFEGIFRDIQQEREEKEDRALHAARKEAREAERAAQMWRALAWVSVLVALVVLFLALQDKAQAAEMDPEPVETEVIQYDPPPAPMPEAEVVVSKPETTTRRLHGSCRITAYCPCEICCGEWAKDRPVDEAGNPIVYGASGNVLTPGVSVACSLPYGTKLEIDGLPGTYVVEDRTAEWIQDKYNGMTVDIYMPNHEACYDLLSGCPEWMDVYIVEEADA